MKNWWKLYKQFWRLSNHEKTNFIKVGLYLIFWRLMLKALPFDKFTKMCSHLLVNKPPINYNRNTVEEIIKTIKTVSNHLFFIDSTCLTQALTAKLMLLNIPNLVLTIGVSLKNGFEAHAWLEKDGNYVIGNTHEKHFTPIWRLE